MAGAGWTRGMVAGSGMRSWGGRERSGLIWFGSHDIGLDFLLCMVINIFRRDFSKNSGDQQNISGFLFRRHSVYYCNLITHCEATSFWWWDGFSPSSRWILNSHSKGQLLGLNYINTLQDGVIQTWVTRKNRRLFGDKMVIKGISIFKHFIGKV